MLVASIPSPSFNAFQVGPFQIRMYGLMIAIGALVAISLAGRRWETRGGNRSDITNLAVWAVPAGVIGARAYHVATDWKTYRHDWVGALAIWKGGLGIPGGVLLGALVGVLVARRRGLPALTLMDVVAPALPIAQAIGRLGNWFNQELFGRPTSLPWALRISAAHRPAGYASVATYHPTFLYEALWNLALAALLLALDRRRKLRPGQLFALYVLGYALGRLWVESLRIDEASLILGVRINIWTSLFAAGVAGGIFLWRQRGAAGVEERPFQPTTAEDQRQPGAGPN